MAILLVCAAVPAVEAQESGSLFERGAEAFLYDRPQEAATLLERAVEQEPMNARAYLYLAVSYEQLGMYERAVNTLNRALTVPGADRSIVQFNLGNNYLQLGEVEAAEAAFSAAIEVSGLNAKPYLNRANIRVQQELFEEAVEDYRMVLSLEPNHPQKAQIEQIIELLEHEIEQERIRVAEEQRRLEEERRREEEARRLEEERRLAEERRLEAERQAAEERRRALLGSVLDSIGDAGDDTTNMSAGNEDIEDLEDEDLDIAD